MSLLDDARAQVRKAEAAAFRVPCGHQCRSKPEPPIGCGRLVDLLCANPSEDSGGGVRCLDCGGVFCRACAYLHFGIEYQAIRAERDKLRAAAPQPSDDAMRRALDSLGYDPDRRERCPGCGYDIPGCERRSPVDCTGRVARRALVAAPQPSDDTGTWNAAIRDAAMHVIRLLKPEGMSPKEPT